MSRLKYWLWLSSLEGVAHTEKIALLNFFGSPEDIRNAAEKDIREAGLSGAQAKAIKDGDMSRADRLLGECEKLGIKAVAMTDTLYPDKLRNIYAPPVVLYIKGELPDIDDEAAVAFVGSRTCTPYGLSSAERIAFQMARHGALVISGMAKGIDAAAHVGALKAGGKTVAVLGCGVDIIYPLENKELYDDICVRGAVISEYPPGTRPLGSNFPARNRIISGLSLGVVVAEAPLRSGALITASHALEQGRDVFAVPGNIDAPGSAGANALIKEGAKLIDCGWDAVREYAALFPHRISERADRSEESFKARKTDFSKNTVENGRVKRPLGGRGNLGDQAVRRESVLQNLIKDFTEDEKTIILSIAEGSHIDLIIEETQLPAGKVAALLTMLELRGAVRQLSGKRFEVAYPDEP